MFKRLASITGILILIFVFKSFKRNEELPNMAITKIYHQQFSEFKSSLDDFKNHIENLNKNAGINKETNIKYERLRKAFKTIETIWEYTDPQFVKEYINGPPLPKLDKVAASLTIVEPKGLQVLDELLGEKKPDLTAIEKQLSEMQKVLSDYKPISKIYDRIVFESIKVELIRLFTLGLTGFDLPGTDNSLSDAITVWNTINSYVNLYKNAIVAKDIYTWNKIEDALNKGKNYLQGKANFSSFDRLGFLRDVLNPLHENLQIAHEKLGIENIYEVASNDSRFALNYKFKKLFDNDILNANFYNSLPSNYQNSKVAELGKILFFDPILSANNERSCASCHQPQKAFTDGLPKSIAMGKTGTVGRNSPTLINCIYSERFFHDLRAESLEDQMEHVVTSKDEFNTSILAISEKLAASDDYVLYFKNAFPDADQPINKQNISFAISAYVSSLKSFNSTFDKYARGEINEIDPKVKRGFNLFMGKAACGTCHFAPVFNGTVPPFFTESESEVLGVPENPYAKKLKLDGDIGRAGAKLKEQVVFYKHSFKTPTVRNISLTAPYMHNGAYKTLHEVMDFYNKGGGRGLGLDVPYQTLPEEKLNLTKTEINEIIAFMEALTDTTSLTSIPNALPAFKNNSAINSRKIGGLY